MNIHWLLHAKRWAQNPPSMGKVKFVFVIIFVCLMAALYEYVYGWPEFLTVPNTRGTKIR